MLQDGHILLRALKDSDSSFLYEAINSPELVRFNAPYKPVHELNHKQWFQEALTDSSKRFFIIETKGKTVGTIQLFDINMLHKNAELSIRIASPQDRGKGIGSIAVALLSEHAFKDMGLVRVWLRAFSNNEPAIKAYEKARFKKEGIMRQAAFINGEFLDMIIMARLFHESV